MPEIVQNSFTGGLNRDTAKALYKPDEYFDLSNFRIIQNGELTTGSLVNSEGNKLLVTLGTNDQIIGHATIRDKLILFTVNSITNDSKIYCYYDDNTNTAVVADTNYPTCMQTPTSNCYLVYTDASCAAADKLNFSVSNKITAYGRYETPSIQKVYWIDGVHQLRYLNIIYNADINKINTFVQSDFNILTNFSQVPVIFENFTTGNLDSGIITYSYQLYRVNGQETNFSTIGELISLFSSATNDSTRYLKGDDIDINTKKGIVAKIDGIDTSFNRIRVVAIHYKDLNIEPEIRIVTEQSFNNSVSTFQFVDDGESLGTYTLSEFNALTQLELIPKCIESKDNYLFVGNVQVPSFDYDIDTRAYRFNSSNKSWLFKYNDVDYSSPQYILNGVTTLPKTADCVNLNNLISLDYSGFPETNTFLYQVDGLTPGATGLNVTIEFEYKKVKVIGVSAILKNIYTIISNDDLLNVVTGKIKSWQRDEIYRLGVVIFNEKGQNTPVKWVCDLRIPYTNDHPLLEKDGIDIYVNYIFPVVKLNNLPANYKYQIVVVERKSNDRTILAQGLLTNHIKYNYSPNDSYRPYYSPYLYEIGTIGSTDIVDIYDFQSPEINFNKSLKFSNGDYIELYNVAVDNLEQVEYGGITDIYSTTNTLFTNKKKPNNTNGGIITNSEYGIDFKTYDGNSISPFTSKPVVTQLETFVSGGAKNAKRGTAFTIDANFSPGYVQTSDKFHIFNYKRPLSNQYGGSGYNDRFNNVYIPCSDITDAGSTAICWYGDTFIGMYDYLRGMIDVSVGVGSNQQICFFPVETSINLYLRGDIPYSKYFLPSTIDLWAMQEVAGEYNNFNQLTDLYIYNATYSRGNDVKQYFSPPFDLQNNEIFDTRVYHSDKKFNGEYTDNWLKFKVNNRLDVDSAYGQIVSLLNFNNLLLFFQNTGFGVLSVNQRSLLKDNNQSQLVLGTGGVLERYDMLSTNYGITENTSLTNSDSTVYFYDRTANKMIRYRQNEEELSVTKKIQSLFDSTIKSDVNTILEYNPLYKEIHFSIPSKLKSLFFSELHDTFVGFFTFSAKKMLNYNNYIWTSPYYNSSNYNKLYKHDIGIKGNFYGVVDSSYLTTITTPKNNFITIYDNIELLTYVYGADLVKTGSVIPIPNGATINNNGIIYRNISGATIANSITTDYADTKLWQKVSNYNTDVLDETISYIKYTNSYQDTGDITLVVLPYYKANNLIKRRIRTWRLDVGRTKTLINGKFQSERMRDNHMITTFTYSNNTNKTIIINNITFYFRNSQL